MSAGLEPEFVEFVDEFTRYDSYFGFVRVPSPGIDVIAAQVVRTLTDLALDLSTAIVGLDEVTAIAEATQAMLQWCSAAICVGSSDPDIISHAENSDREEDGGPLRELTDQAFVERRWVLGHHFFNLCAVFCKDAIDGGAAAIEQGEPLIAAERIEHATLYLRATTAAMWYAGNYPARLYVEHVRPSMATRSGKDSGFSGTHNLDYCRLRISMDRLKERLPIGLSRFDDWPSTLRNAVANLLEVEIEDVEQHILIAAGKVGTTPSLLQESARHDRLPPGIRVISAADMLREMADERRLIAERILYGNK